VLTCAGFVGCANCAASFIVVIGSTPPPTGPSTVQLNPQQGTFMNTTARPSVALAGVALAIAALTTGPAMAGDDSAGMRVVRDPVTGQVRAPTHEEFKAMQDEEKAAKAVSRSAVSAPADPAATASKVRRADGSLGMRVGESFLSFAVVTRKTDGSLAMDCVTGADAAEQVVRGKIAPSKNKEHGHDHQ
jgi:hypothetical protein